MGQGDSRRSVGPDWTCSYKVSVVVPATVTLRPLEGLAGASSHCGADERPTDAVTRSLVGDVRDIDDVSDVLCVGAENPFEVRHRDVAGLLPPSFVA